MPTITVAGIKLPVSRGVASFVAILLATAVGGGLLLKQASDPEDYKRKLVSAEHASKNLQAAVNEYGKHLFEKPEKLETYFDDNVRGTLQIGTYADGCTSLSRSYQGRRFSKLIVDLARLDAVEQDSYKSPTAPEAFTQNLRDLLSTVLVASGRCLNPHPPDYPPPPFATHYGNRIDGCWIQVWRNWRDGCEHVQLLNTCNGMWDTNQDGTPRVQWTRCVH